MDPQKLELNAATDELSVDLKKENQQLHQILLTCTQLNKIKTNLNQMIDSLAQNPSFFSRTAKLWNTIPWWQKLIAGTVLTIPLLLAGIFAHIGVLTTLSICIFITYTVSSFALDNHQSHNINNTARLKSSIGDLADLLGTSIMLMQNLHEMIAEQIEVFHNENNRLTEKINELAPQSERLALQVEQLQQVKQTLSTTITNLEQTHETLKTSEQEQTRLFSETKKELEQVKARYEENEHKLRFSTDELTKTNKLLKSELEIVRVIAKSFQEAYATLNDQLLSNNKHRETFGQHVTEILNNQEQCFVDVMNQFNQSEHNLQSISDHLKEMNQKYESFLDRLEENVQNMEAHLLQDIQPGQTKNTKPNTFSFYNKTTKTTSDQTVIDSREEQPIIFNSP